VTAAAAPRGWIHVASLLGSQRAPSAAEAEAIDLVHDLWRNWRDGMPLHEVRQHSTGRERWTAARFTPPAHALFRPLHEMLDALIRTDATDPAGMQYQTRYGTFSELDFRVTRARLTRGDDGRIRVVFPIRYPWVRKPDPEHGDGGEADAPVYAETAEDRMRIANQAHIRTDAPRRPVFS